MSKILIAIMATALLSGCAMFDKRVAIKNEVQEVKVPLLYCPAVIDTTRPVLQIYKLPDVESTSDGELVKAYTASILQLQGYVDELETLLDAYDEANKAYDELRSEFQRKLGEEIQNSGTDE